MDFSVLISSSVVAGLVGALIALRNSERKIQVENVTGERAKWRAAMRELAADLAASAQAQNQQKVVLLSGQLELNLNPFDEEDKALVTSARNLASGEKLDEHTREFWGRMALLLKHDWDRAKREAQPWFFRRNEPHRVPYCDHLRGNSAAKPSVTSWRKQAALVWNFITLSISAGIIFFLVAGLAEPFQQLVKIFNDSTTEKPMGAWFQFIGWSVLCGSMWSAAYLWFKGSEKKFLEIWFDK